MYIPDYIERFFGRVSTYRFSVIFLHIKSFTLSCRGRLYLCDRNNTNSIIYIECKDEYSTKTIKKIKNKLTFSIIEFILLSEDALYLRPTKLKKFKIYNLNGNKVLKF